MTNVLSVRNLGFRYKNGPVFSNVNFEVARGEFVAITGSNGSGKSTLLRICLGELKQYEGEVRLFGCDAGKFIQWQRIGYLQQYGAAALGGGGGEGFPATVREIVRLNLFSQIGLFRFPKCSHNDKAMKAIASVGMSEFARNPVGSLSGGQRQRVLLARVLAGEPELLLLDEPTTGVDAHTVESFFYTLSKLNAESKLTIAIVTHDIEKASEHVSRILCLEDGSMVELGKHQITKELMHRHRHPSRQNANT